MLVFFRNKDKVYLQSASITNSRKIRITDFALELFGKAPEESPMGYMGRISRMRDGRVEYVFSKGVWIELRDIGGWDRDLLRVIMGERRSIFCSLEGGSHGVGVKAEHLCYVLYSLQSVKICATPLGM